MRTSNFNSAKLAPVDRNARFVQAFWSTVPIAPHTSIVRLVYTVPIGQKAILQYCHINLLRVTAATTAGRPRILIQTSVNGADNIVYFHSNEITNTPQSAVNTTTDLQLDLRAGDTVRFITLDDSIDGLCEYAMSYRILEYAN